MAKKFRKLEIICFAVIVGMVNTFLAVYFNNNHAAIGWTCFILITLLIN